MASVGESLFDASDAGAAGSGAGAERAERGSGFRVGFSNSTPTSCPDLHINLAWRLEVAMHMTNASGKMEAP